MISKINPEAISPGYWFVAPYFLRDGHHVLTSGEHVPCETGAHIYDGDGVRADKIL